MNSERSSGQVSVLIFMDRELRSRIEAVAPEKSQFIRTAIREKIERTLGLEQGALVGLDAPPSRSGKGGKPTHHTNAPSGLALNDTASAKTPKPATASDKVSYLRRKKAKP